jgi:outer membrane biosynthesis protein TonB
MQWDRWWEMGMAETAEAIPQEISFTFPENKPPEQPREIVENINENEEIPEQSNLLSDRNSRARNEERTEQTGDKPKSMGNSPFANLSRPQASQRNFQTPGFRKFSSDALTGKQVPDNKKQEEEEARKAQQQSQSSLGTNQNFDQKDFSVEELGALSLSTYKWKYAPYVNALKRKLYRVWNVPPAFYMGLISGYSIIVFEISKDGKLLNIKLLEHRGHESLEVASMESIKALFPFIPLPDDFPEETLIITAKLHYPNFKNRR